MRDSQSFVSLAVFVFLAALPLVAADEGLLARDKEGNPLPFDSADQLLTFMRTAAEISSKTLPEGITRARKLRLAKDGIELNVVFHHIDRQERKAKRLPNGRVVMYLRDSYTGQLAAYELSRLLGLDNVPPTVPRRSKGLRGSAQLWIENAMTETGRRERGLDPPDFTIWNQRYADMSVFDNLINNIDRNQGNMLVDPQWHLWLIDHTRTFGRDKGLPQPEAVTRCSRALWSALRNLNPVKVEAQLGDYLTPSEIRALFHRRDKLIEAVESRIAEVGEDRVLFDYGDPDPGIHVHYEE